MTLGFISGLDFFPLSQHFMQPSGAFKTHLDILFLRITFEGITLWPHVRTLVSSHRSHLTRAGDNMRKLMGISKLWEQCPGPLSQAPSVKTGQDFTQETNLEGIRRGLNEISCLRFNLIYRG